MSLFLLQWVVVLLVALYAMYKGAEIVQLGLKQMGVAFKVQPRYYGAVLAGIASALPVLALAVSSVFFGQSPLVMPLVMGSALTYLLLIGGMVACVGGSIVLWEDFLKTALPVFCITVVLFVLSVQDGVLDRLEAILFLCVFCIFLGNIFVVSRAEKTAGESTQPLELFSLTSLVYVIFGLVALIVGAKFTIDMVVNIAYALSITVPLLGISVIAFLVTLPTLFLVLKALRRKDVSYALGVIIGAAVSTLLAASGFASLWSGNVIVHAMVIDIGVPILIVAAIIIFVSSLSRHFVRPVGLMMMLVFIFFLLKLTAYIG